MNKRKIEYLILMLIFILFLFRNNFLTFMQKKDNNLNKELLNNICNTTLEEENNNLKTLLNYDYNADFSYHVSKVLYRDIYNFKEEITIYKGKNNNLKVGDAVIDNYGLVGVIENVYPNKALVKLITNKKINISVKINDSYGILKTDNEEIYVSNLTKYDNVSIGDNIYTSGIGNLPGNILIGKVKDITIDELDIEKIISIELAASLNNLNYVFIVGLK